VKFWPWKPSNSKPFVSFDPEGVLPEPTATRRRLVALGSGRHRQGTLERSPETPQNNVASASSLYFCSR
jgi:hypothetical protein